MKETNKYFSSLFYKNKKEKKKQNESIEYKV